MERVHMIIEWYNGATKNEYKKYEQSVELNHFFVTLDKEFNPKQAWRTSFFNPETKKMVSFSCDTGEKLVEDDVADPNSIEPLPLQSYLEWDHVKGLLSDLPEHGDGFAMLTSINGTVYWSLSFILKNLKILHVRVNALTGEREDKVHEFAMPQ